jgi:CPA2 family monovalent cation:H+ antiporter-2
MHGLSLIVLILSIVVFAVVAFRYLHLPPILGYLSVGVLIGPYALKLLPDPALVARFSELGIVFLMFTIGLEFSLPKLKALRRLVFGLGAVQVVGTILVFALLGWLFNHILPAQLNMSGTGWIALGGVLAMSSTAILMKLLTERLELDSVHGRNIFSVLLFQDLAVAPLLILIPVFAQTGQSEGALLGQLAWGVFKTILVLVVLLSLGQKPMHAWLTVVVRRRSNELFMLNLFLMTLGFAWLTEMAGLSLALGAFIAGMLISETEYQIRVEEDINPFKDILLGLFFVAMGMQLDLVLVLREWFAVLCVLTLMLSIKFALVLALVRAFGQSTGNAIRTALALAPAGEFGLVLLNLALGNALLNPIVAQWVLAAIILSMFLTPFILKYADKIVFRATRTEWLLQSLQLTHVVSHSMEAHDHVIIAGFGRSGKALARLLKGQNVPYMGIDADPENVQRGILKGHDVVYGDATRKESLSAAGVQRARALVITYIEPRAALHILHHVRELNPDLPVIVRTLDDAYLEQLQNAGAVAVVPEILEGSLVLATQTLLSAGATPQDVLAFIAEQRRGRYDLLRQHFDDESDPFGLSSATPDALAKQKNSNPPRTEQTNAYSEHATRLSDESLWTDQAISNLPLAAWRVRIKRVVRGLNDLDIQLDPVLLEGDELYFEGRADDVRHAAQALNGEI